MNKTISNFCETTFGRYELYTPNCLQKQALMSLPKAHLNHAMFWHDKVSKVTVHTNSKKLLDENFLYAVFSLACETMTCQSPSLVKTKVSISSFKMMKNTALGSRVHLRRQQKLNFCYKWAFLSPYALGTKKMPAKSSLGLNNLFAFELGSLDYDAFELIPGCDISFDFKIKPEQKRKKPC